ncbi:MAG: class I SAM-dependent methyltransferase [Bdellovibrionaceae bacterium]|nr:class I SAM-dependent methyltransferase [Pseudobdellovibrionaceae bacterium]
MSEKTSLADGYIHGFSKEEQDRLLHQARVHEEIIFSNIDFSGAKKIVEVGSGVGAQTQILLERFPQAHIDCVDASDKQIERARQTLSGPIAQGRVRLHQGDAMNLPFKGDEFDGAFICWLLEHLQNPVGVLSEVRRVLKSGGVIYCNEVLNATFYLHPYSPATLKYWFEFNDQQWELKGDPFVGGKLANYLMKAGYQNISTKVLTHQYDNRLPKKRAAFIDYWTDLMLSGAPELIKSGRVSAETVEEMKSEFQVVKNDPDSVVFYSWILARAEAY